MKKIFTLIISAIILFVFSACPSKSSSDEKGTFRGILYENVKKNTAKGVRVMSASNIDDSLLPKIDEGLDKLFRIATSAPNNYQVNVGHNGYKVWLFPRSPKCINPGFLVNADGSPYDNGEFDKDPRPGVVRVCAAGMMVDGLSFGMLVVDDLATMATIVRYEGEHIILLHHDPDRFAATMYHTDNSHPIMPDMDGNFTSDDLQYVKDISFTLPEDLKFKDKLLASKGAKICVLLSK